MKKLLILLGSLVMVLIGLLFTLILIKNEVQSNSHIKANNQAAKKPLPRPKVNPNALPDANNALKPAQKSKPAPPSSPKPAEKPPTLPKLDIRLTQKVFKTDPENFGAVCNSAAMAIARHYPKHPFKPILIPKADNRFPVMLDQRGPKGESQIMLSIGDGWGWAQIAFQFSHEFTHIIINENQPGAGPNHWINEAFCEAASYHALKTMAGMGFGSDFFVFGVDFVGMGCGLAGSIALAAIFVSGLSAGPDPPHPQRTAVSASRNPFIRTPSTTLTASGKAEWGDWESHPIHGRR